MDTVGPHCVPVGMLFLFFLALPFLVFLFVLPFLPICLLFLTPRRLLATLLLPRDPLLRAGLPNLFLILF